MITPNFSQNGYTVVEQLGKDRGQGRRSYQAIRNSDRQPVTIKLFSFAAIDKNWSGYSALEREKRILQQLDHPSIPRFLDSFESDVGSCLVLEDKAGQPLSTLVYLTPEQLKQIAEKVLPILTYLHQQNPLILHGRIEPENILIGNEGNIYLVDFGFAQTIGASWEQNMGMSSTTKFVSPEIIKGCPPTPAADLYSLGRSLIYASTKAKTQLSLSFLKWLRKLICSNPGDRFENATVALTALQSLEPQERTRLSHRTVIYLSLIAVSASMGAWFGSQKHDTAWLANKIQSTYKMESRVLNAEEQRKLDKLEQQFNERKSKLDEEQRQIERQQTARLEEAIEKAEIAEYGEKPIVWYAKSWEIFSGQNERRQHFREQIRIQLAEQLGTDKHVASKRQQTEAQVERLEQTKKQKQTEIKKQTKSSQQKLYQETSKSIKAKYGKKATDWMVFSAMLGAVSGAVAGISSIIIVLDSEHRGKALGILASVILGGTAVIVGVQIATSETNWSKITVPASTTAGAIAFASSVLGSAVYKIYSKTSIFDELGFNSRTVTISLLSAKLGALSVLGLVAGTTTAYLVFSSATGTAFVVMLVYPTARKQQLMLLMKRNAEEN